MRFLVDAQLPPALASWIVQRGHEAMAAREVGLRDAGDPVVWKFAVEGVWVVVTKDEDFAERVLRTGAGPQIVWLRIGNCTNRVLFAWLEPLWPSIIQQLVAGVQAVEVKRTL
jgi:predicted nuclease of predicted toxin-antitoxin system